MINIGYEEEVLEEYEDKHFLYRVLALENLKGTIFYDYTVKINNILSNLKTWENLDKVYITFMTQGDSIKMKVVVNESNYGSFLIKGDEFLEHMEIYEYNFLLYGFYKRYRINSHYISVNFFKSFNVGWTLQCKINMTKRQLEECIKAQNSKTLLENDRGSID